MAYSDVELLARIIQCEAGGEGDTGMKAVATVVMNRVTEQYGEYGRYNTVRDVIFQPGQFDCAREVIGGRYNPQNIYNMEPTGVHYDVASWAIAGNKIGTIAYALWYFNPFIPSCREFFPSEVGALTARIGQHCFYTPTSSYYLT